MSFVFGSARVPFCGVFGFCPWIGFLFALGVEDDDEGSGIRVVRV